MSDAPLSAPASHPASSPATPALPRGRAPLAHLGVISAQGADVVGFLQGQLTQDVVLLGQDAARLAAYCSPKGRMQASFVVVKRSDEELLLVCEKNVLPAVVKRLSMFVLRAKARLQDASAQFQVWGIAGPVPGLPLSPWARLDAGGAHFVSLYPADGQPLALCVAPEGQAPEALTGLPQADLPAASWQWLQVRSGVVLVGQPCFEAFVPQMLNYESVGGVSFKKGCYPGQEVVARSQFRGTLKRRAYLAHATGPLAAGDEVFHAGDPDQPCGLVAAAAPRPDGSGWDALVSLQVSCAQEAAAGLHAAQPQGPILTLLPLPYPLLEDI